MVVPSGSSPSQVAKQATISNFFKRKAPADESSSLSCPLSKKSRVDSGPPATSVPKTLSSARASDFIFIAPQGPHDLTRTSSEIKEKKQRHQKFVKRFLGKDLVSEISQRDDDDSERPSDGENDESEEESSKLTELQKKFAAPGKARISNSKAVESKIISTLTPLERQYLKFREENPGVLLIIEVGYKFKFYGDDAKIASQILNIACLMSGNFFSASIPVHRLSIHVRNLVNAGHKVGVVRQVETAALKASSDTKNKLFERKLTNLYTK
ncbi:DNA mismatch repair protein msh3, partial [Neolecta irregularis DAH-3]